MGERVSLLCVLYLCVLALITVVVLFSSWPAICIHGDKEQRERDWVLAGKCVCVCGSVVCDRVVCGVCVCVDQSVCVCGV